MSNLKINEIKKLRDLLKKEEIIYSNLIELIKNNSKKNIFVELDKLKLCKKSEVILLEEICSYKENGDD